MSFVEGMVLVVLIICVSMIILSVTQKLRTHHGQIIVMTDEDGTHYSLEFDGDPYDIQHMKSVSFKVVKKEDNA